MTPFIRRCSCLVVAVASAACSRADPSGAIHASGHVEATEVRISSKVAGRLRSLAVREGDDVAAGAEIAQVDPVDLELAIRAARADRDQADAELRLRVAGARSEDIAEAEAGVAQAQADLESARKDLERMRSLLERGSGTAKARDDALARRDVATSRVDGARERLRKLVAGSRPEELDAARARLAASGARLAQLEQQLADTAVTSPRAGVVTEKVAEAGEQVAPGTPIVVVTDVREPWLTVYVAEPDLDSVRLGAEVRVRTDAGTERKGRVNFIASKAEFTPKNVQTRDERVKLVFEVRIALDNPDGLFKPGMPAEAILPRVAGGHG